MPTTADLEKVQGALSDAELADIMNDKAVTNISGWTEPNFDTPCDEKAEVCCQK